MRFVIKHAAMSAEETHFDELDLIVARVEQAIHIAEIPDADLLLETEWYRSCRPTRQKLLEEIARQSAYARPKSGVHSKCRVVAAPEDVISNSRLAWTPLEIVVENATSDTALVGAAIREFATCEGLALCLTHGAQMQPPAVNVIQAGGNGEVMKVVSRLIAEARERSRDYRIVVITDSDGEFEGDVKNEATAIREGCRHLGIACPELNKRTAENYVPDQIWEEWAEGKREREPAVEALLRLTPQQRDYMKIDGSNTAPWNSTNPDAAKLFASVSAQDRDVMTRASLKGRGEGMTILRLNSLTDGGGKAGLVARDHAGDLARMVKTIEDEL